MSEDDPLLISRQVSTTQSYDGSSSATASHHQTSHILTDIEVEEASIITFPLAMAVLVATLLQFMLGYNTSVMNAPAAVVFPGHSTVEWSLAVAAFAIGGPFGALVGGPLANQRGRRGAILLCTCKRNIYICLFNLI